VLGREGEPLPPDVRADRVRRRRGEGARLRHDGGDHQPAAGGRRLRPLADPSPEEAGRCGCHPIGSLRLSDRVRAPGRCWRTWLHTVSGTRTIAERRLAERSIPPPSRLVSPVPSLQTEYSIAIEVRWIPRADGLFGQHT